MYPPLFFPDEQASSYEHLGKRNDKSHANQDEKYKDEKKSQFKITHELSEIVGLDRDRNRG